MRRAFWVKYSEHDHAYNNIQQTCLGINRAYSFLWTILMILLLWGTHFFQKSWKEILSNQNMHQLYSILIFGHLSLLWGLWIREFPHMVPSIVKGLCLGFKYFHFGSIFNKLYARLQLRAYEGVSSHCPHCKIMYKI